VKKIVKCWSTRDEFLVAVGVVNAEISQPRTGLRYETKYRLVAERIESMGRSIGAQTLHTITDEGVHVVTVKGFLVSK
jgi:hypothetical protein